MNEWSIDFYYSPSELEESESGSAESEIDTEFYLASFYSDSMAADWYAHQAREAIDYAQDMQAIVLAWNQR